MCLIKESLESALLEAAFLSEIIFGWMANTLEFEKRACRCLSEDDCSHVYWAVSTLNTHIREARRIFYIEEEAERIARQERRR